MTQILERVQNWTNLLHILVLMRSQFLRHVWCFYSICIAAKWHATCPVANPPYFGEKQYVCPTKHVTFCQSPMSSIDWWPILQIYNLISETAELNKRWIQQWGVISVETTTAQTFAFCNLIIVGESNFFKEIILGQKARSIIFYSWLLSSWYLQQISS